MAKSKKKKKSRPSAKAKANHSKKYSAKKKKNPGVSLATVRAMLSKKKKKGHSKKRNPSFMGVSGSEAVANSAAVMGAVTIAKLVPPLFPAAWTATDLGRFLTTAGVAAIEVFAAHMLIPRYRTMVLAGAGAQTFAVALNPVLRKVSSTITLGRMRSLKDFVPGNFPEPHNPIWQKALASGQLNSGAPSMMGMDRYSPAY